MDRLEKGKPGWYKTADKDGKIIYVMNAGDFTIELPEGHTLVEFVTEDQSWRPQ